MKKAMLVVSFGTTYKESMEKNINNTVNHIASFFEDYDIFQAYTSIIIRKKLTKQGYQIDDVKTALEKIKKSGYNSVLIVSLHIMAGYEYEKILNNAKLFNFEDMKITTPLISEEKDYKIVANTLNQIYKDEKNPIILMGHGSEHKNDIIYEKLQLELDKINDDKYYISTVEGKVVIDDIMEKLKNKKVKEVTLYPLMLVCGDHAHNDMAGDEEDSYANILKKNNIIPHPVLKGLGEYSLIGDCFVEKIKEVLKK